MTVASYHETISYYQTPKLLPVWCMWNSISWSLLKLMYWVSDAIQPSHHLSPTSPVSVRFQWVSLLHQVTKALELQLQHQPFQWILMVDFLWDWLVWSPCSPRDSQQSSPTPQFESIISSVLSLLYGPTLTSIHDYWKNHSFNYTDFWQQSDIPAY